MQEKASMSPSSSIAPDIFHVNSPFCLGLEALGVLLGRFCCLCFNETLTNSFMQILPAVAATVSTDSCQDKGRERLLWYHRLTGVALISDKTSAEGWKMIFKSSRSTLNIHKCVFLTMEKHSYSWSFRCLSVFLEFYVPSILPHLRSMVKENNIWIKI